MDTEFNHFIAIFNTWHNIIIINGYIMHTADCGVPLVNSNIKLNYSSALDGSVLILTCENEISSINTTDEEILIVTCHNNGSWIPNPAQFNSPLHVYGICIRGKFFFCKFTYRSITFFPHA